jgi:cyclopropane-fatty-acyl-phospholipid synthase
MNIAAKAVAFADSHDLPDFLVRAGIWSLCARTRLSSNDNSVHADKVFAGDMASRPIALNTDDANAQHYEIPAEFFGLILGPHRKYSCCLFDATTHTLGDGEKLALQETCVHADLRDGQTILELGCGWGSLSLYMAENYPESLIVSVSNSHSQRHYIEGEASRRGLTNLTVITADMNVFDIAGKFDRIMSVEMFEHMSNWRFLLTKARGWLKPEGRMFMHVFSHRAMSYRFDHTDPADWIAQYFFTGGIMPSHGLVRQFPDLFEVEQEWIWNGENYARTARHWLQNFDANRTEIDRILKDVYGADAPAWRRRWRMFFLATEGLFGHAGGNEWAVSHYRLKPAE